MELTMITRGRVMDFDGMTGWVGHTLSTAAIVGTIAGILPPIAALAAFVWYLVQLYESKTVRKWLANRRARKIASLKAKVHLLESFDREPR